ncbi:MAG: hypothetical protein H6829_09600 [Planctomycetes bacterium]|nr:hypothetical protein [Planctomycetota bacterium]MCB9912630.1 hypothetical protein [Planctomycetota bacterium]HPF15334.1 hypothetical protein [Planctomycetota bacterium]
MTSANTLPAKAAVTVLSIAKKLRQFRGRMDPTTAAMAINSAIELEDLGASLAKLSGEKETLNPPTEPVDPKDQTPEERGETASAPAEQAGQDIAGPSGTAEQNAEGSKGEEASKDSETQKKQGKTAK